MTIIGKAAAPSADVIERAAKIVNCEPAVIDAIIKVETLGEAYDVKNRLIIRPEFHKIASCPLLDTSAKKRAAKLARPKLVGYHVDSGRAGDVAWNYVGRFAASFGAESAYWITSFGAPQIMGFNHTLCKFSSATAMVEAFADGWDAQILAMAEFLVASGLKDACRQRKWSVIARLYNGPNYAKNDYDTKLSNAYAHSDFARASVAPWPEDDVLELGEKGPEIKALQLRLGELGFYVRADGDFGPETRDAVRTMQFRLGLGVDGKVGPLTKRALASAAPKDAPQTPVAEVVRASGTAQASLAQIGVGAVATAVAGASAITPAAPLPTLTDVDAALKASEQGIGLASKILAIGVDKLLMALGIGALIFGAIALYRRVDAHYKRKIG